MAIKEQLFPIIIMALILVFSAIHLGVSIGIIVPFRQYDDIFRPQIGLSAFNIVISLFGFITGILGLVAIFMKSEQFGKIVCIVSGVVGIFALASLVAAIIINAKSLNYVSSSFLNNMLAYQSNQDVRNRVDKIQMSYQCCGKDIWLDWVHAGLVVTSSGTNVTTTTTTATTQNSSSITTSSSTTTIGTYGGIENLPLSFTVTFPRSCCTSEALLSSNTSNAYCVSNANNAVNHFYTDGCTKALDTVAGNQAMGLGVINSFMVVLAFVAIPIMLKRSNVSD